MNEKKVLVYAKTHYGTEYYYPANEKARILTRIAGKQTLNEFLLDYARELGFEVRLTINQGGMDHELPFFPEKVKVE